MRKFILSILFFLIPVLLGIIILFTLKVDKNFSYRYVQGECSNKAGWIYDRLYSSDKKTEVVFVGASQTSCAIMDQFVESELKNLMGKNLKVANLGYCRGGRDVQFLILKEVFRKKKPELVVIEVTEDEPKKSHPVFPYLAETGDLFGSFKFLNQRFFSGLWKGLNIRLEFVKWKIFKDTLFIPDSTVEFSYLPSDLMVNEEDIHENKKNWDKRLKKDKSEFQSQIETRYSKHYVEKMVNLAKANHCEFVFLYLHESGNDLKTPKYYKDYLQKSEVILLPDSIYQNHKNWMDVTHFNDRGAKLASTHIAKTISEFLK